MRGEGNQGFKELNLQALHYQPATTHYQSPQNRSKQTKQSLLVKVVKIVAKVMTYYEVIHITPMECSETLSQHTGPA